MDARLVEIENRRRVSVTPLGPELRIGRDPTSDLISDYARVSRFHAVIRELGGKHMIFDAGSTNGTTVNGTRVKDTPVLLEPGDIIELSGEVVFLYETGPFRTATPWVVLALAMLGMLIGVGGFVLYQRATSDPTLDRAIEIALEGTAASERGERETARRKLRAAAGLLYSHGLLEDVQRRDVLRVALERLTQQMGGEPNLWDVLSKNAAPPEIPERAAQLGQRPCELDRVVASDVPSCLRSWVTLVLGELDADSGVPRDLDSRIAHRMIVEHTSLAQGLARADEHRAAIARALSGERIPRLVHYLALIESGYDPEKDGAGGRAGLWQLTAETAREYGLRVDETVDARNAPTESTRAAAHYLRDLNFEFGGDTLLLAIAAFNQGEASVRSSLRSLDDPFAPDPHWRLLSDGLLADGPEKQLESFLAASVAGEGGLPSVERLENAGY